jgi:hypothetical protein
MKSVNRLIAEFLHAKKAGLVLNVVKDENYSDHNPYLTIIFRYGVLNDVVRNQLFRHIEHAYTGVYAESAPHAPSMIFVYYVPGRVKIAA